MPSAERTLGAAPFEVALRGASRSEKTIVLEAVEAERLPREAGQHWSSDKERSGYDAHSREDTERQSTAVVRAQADFDAHIQHVRDPRDARPQVEVRVGAVRDAGLSLFDELHLVVREEDAVCEDGVAAEEAEVVVGGGVGRQGGIEGCTGGA